MKWQGIIGWTSVAIGAVLLLALIGGSFYLKTNSFRQFAMREIVTQADQVTGGHTQLQNFDLQLSTLTAHLYGIVVRGKEPADAPPLLAADSLTVKLKILSVLHHKINLRELLIEHLVANLQVNRRGETNLPEAPPSKSNSGTNVFELAVGHIGITNGEVNYKDRKMPLDADLRNLTTAVRVEPAGRRSAARDRCS